MRVNRLFCMLIVFVGIVVICGTVFAQTSWRERWRDRFKKKADETTLSIGSAKLSPGIHSLSMQHDGSRRTFLVYVPRSYTDSKAAPLVFVFHGGGGAGKNMREKITLGQFDCIADREGQIIVYPDGLSTKGDVTAERHWNDNRWEPGTEFEHMDDVDDIGFVKEMIEILDDKLNIDKNRIYAAGFSNGAMFSMRLACELSDTLAAVACVGGCSVPRRTYSCAPLEPISILMIQSKDDQYLPWEDGPIYSLRGPRGDVIGIEKVAKKWASYDGCRIDPIHIQDPDIADDGTTVSHYVYSGCKDGREVILYEIIGGGHTWPGAWEPLLRKMKEVFGRTSKDINATTLIMDFFNRHPKR